MTVMKRLKWGQFAINEDLGVETNAIADKDMRT